MWFSKVTRKEFAIVSMGSLDFSFVFLISCRDLCEKSGGGGGGGEEK